MTTIPFGISKHSIPFKNSKYLFNLTVNSDPRINKTSLPPNEQIHFIMFIDLHLMAINPPLPEISYQFYFSTHLGLCGYKYSHHLQLAYESSV